LVERDISAVDFSTDAPWIRLTETVMNDAPNEAPDLIALNAWPLKRGQRPE